MSVSKLEIDEFVLVRDKAEADIFAANNPELKWASGHPLKHYLYEYFPVIILRHARTDGKLTRISSNSGAYDCPAVHMRENFPLLKEMKIRRPNLDLVFNL